MDSFFLRKRWAEQPFWGYARRTPTLHPALTALVETEQTPIGRRDARQVFAYFRELGMTDDARARNLRIPVELLAPDGTRVAM
jgi:hypothetical protein